MTYADRLSTPILPQASALLVVGIFSLGLTGCYTQLQTADSTSPPATTAPQAQDAPRTQETSAENEPTYAREYRREYRKEEAAPDDYGSYVPDGPSLGAGPDYRYKYKYKYEAPYASHIRYDRFCEDRFHDPFYSRARCGPAHGSRFSFSLRFGAPYYSYPSFGHLRFSPYRFAHGVRYASYGYGIGHSPYASYVVGNQYIIHNDEEAPSTANREDRRRDGAFGRGATSVSAAQRRAGERSARRSSLNRNVRSAASDGRIGRSSPSRQSADRSGPDRTRFRDRSGRSERDRTQGRVGRSANADADRPRTTRSRRATRSTRTDRRSRAADRRREAGRRSARSDDRPRARPDAGSPSDRSRRRTRRRADFGDENRRSSRPSSRSSSGTADSDGERRRDLRRRTSPRRSSAADQFDSNHSTVERSSSVRRRAGQANTRTRSSSTRTRSTRDRSRSESARSDRRSSRSERESGSDDGDSR